MTKEELNIKISQYLKEIEDRYNYNCLPFDTVTGTWKGDTQLLNLDEDAFRLDSPMSGSIRTIRPKPKDGNNWKAAITRNRISKSMYNVMLSNPDKIKQSLHLIITQMIKQQIEKIDISPDTVTMGVYLTFKTPNGDYLRELEYDAGYEIRLYSHCLNLETLYENKNQKTPPRS